MKRRTAREKALQAIFQIDVSEVDPASAIEHVLENAPSNEFLNQLVNGVVENKEAIDEIIKKNLENWTLERLATVDRNLLRLSVYELLFCKDTPQNVVIDEGIEIAKLYGDDQSSKFINGVLSKIKHQL
ncbi:transcription antitermination factor NusB [Bacillus sp. DTU_2020_1000418_1_SI_GHA_SEK_038]|uniref:transcription antitermination factor NusB n=1 Tax=Bacillus sp. DTU_2020_1000418_1_SI_GHA_SEK_038 TaxID=3077585 RepID=UPI0028E2D07A|nr:transcription antitermination factor NusB [Bacillus sp. DTU_2020_1000418_1_SI_GHA_SEK_038]WNS74179.1 transcription antitermination factor NusB [Bacillus sp. DTU_2020_1000418_1_SI_GHA_SEK_038]